MDPEAVRRRLSAHPLWDSLPEWEQTLTGKLAADLGTRQLVLPFRADSKIGKPVIVAAETVLAETNDQGQVLLVVHDTTLLEGWCEMWARYGRLEPDGLTDQAPGPLPVTVTHLENLARHEDAYRTRRYELVLSSGSGPGTIDYVTMAAKGERYWRLRPQEQTGYDYEDGSWCLGRSGAYLLDPRTWGLAAAKPWSPFIRQRLSPLAQRAQSLAAS